MRTPSRSSLDVALKGRQKVIMNRVMNGLIGKLITSLDDNFPCAFFRATDNIFAEAREREVGGVATFDPLEQVYKLQEGIISVKCLFSGDTQ